MSSEERRQVLKMVEDGKISAEQALTLIRELEQDTPEAHETETGPGFEGEAGFPPENGSAPELEQTADQARRLWLIPLVAGLVVTIFSAIGMYAAMKGAGYNFWFYCLSMPFLLGVAVIAFAGWSRSARWLFVDVDRSRAQDDDGPKRIFLGFPLPLGLAGWFLRMFGSRIEGLKNTNVDEVVNIISMAKSIHDPLIVNVDEGEDGDRVKVYIG